MERITSKRKLTVIKLYLSGLSYDEIASRIGVSKGTVANVVTELKAGSFPEAADVGEHIELLRDLSSDLRRSGLSPGQCATGLLLLSRISECGLDPADVDRWPMILKSVPSEDDAKEFVRLVYSIQGVQQRTGLDLEALSNEAHQLEKKAADMASVADNVKACEKQLAELTKKRDELASAVALVEQKNKMLTPRVKDLERRESTFSRRIADMEPRARKAEETLAAVKSEIQKLAETGFTLSELAGFNDRLQVIAQRHAVEPGKLRSRLLHELEALDKGLSLETLVKTRRQELQTAENTLATTQNEIETNRAVVDSLNREKMALEANIEEMREKVGNEIAGLIPLAEETIDRLGQEMRRGNEAALAAMHQLRDEAIEAGREIGRCEAVLQVNAWLNDVMALVRGEDGIDGKRVRVMTLSILRALQVWFERHSSLSLSTMTITHATERLISEMEAWET